MLTKVQKWGNSVALRIPKAFVEEMRMTVDTAVEMSIEDGKLVISPVEREGDRCEEPDQPHRDPQGAGEPRRVHQPRQPWHFRPRVVAEPRHAPREKDHPERDQQDGGGAAEHKAEREREIAPGGDPMHRGHLTTRSSQTASVTCDSTS